MTTLLLAGAETGSLGGDGEHLISGSYGINGTARVTTGPTVVSASAAFKSAAAGTTLEWRLDGNASGTLYIDVAVRRASLSDTFKLELHGDSGLIGYLGFVSGFPAWFNAAGTAQLTAVNPVREAVAGTYYVIQAKIVLGGTAQLWGNGRYDETGLVLISSPAGGTVASGPVNRVRVVFDSGVLVDDITINDSTYYEGAVLAALTPAAVVDTDLGSVIADVAKGSGTGAYGSTSTTGVDQVSTWSVGATNGSAATFGPVQVSALVAKSGYDETRVTIKQGGSTVYSPGRFISDEFRYAIGLFDTDGAAAGWSSAGIGSSSFGITVDQPTSTA